MARSDRPAIRPIGPTWQEVRTEIGARQQDVAKAVGLKGGQSAISNREADPDTNPRAIEPRPIELVRFEDAYHLQRGTVLRRAGYVVDALDPLDLIDGHGALVAHLRRLAKSGRPRVLGPCGAVPPALETWSVRWLVRVWVPPGLHAR